MVDRRLVLLVVFTLLAYGLWTTDQNNSSFLTDQYRTIRLQISSVSPDF